MAYFRLSPVSERSADLLLKVRGSSRAGVTSRILKHRVCATFAEEIALAEGPK